MIPWRIRAFFSQHFPLCYHLLANFRTRQNSEEYWDHAFEVSWQAKSRDWPTKNKLIKLLTSPSSRILDVGCSTGTLLRYLKNEGYQHLEGLEISQRAVEILSKYGIIMHRAKLPDLPLSDHLYDFVIASQVLEHIIQRKKFLHGLRRILKPTGTLIIFVPDNCLGPIDEPSHVVKFNKTSLAKELSVYFDSVFVESMKDLNFEMPILFAYAQNGTSITPHEKLATTLSIASRNEASINEASIS